MRSLEIVRDSDKGLTPIKNEPRPDVDAIKLRIADLSRTEKSAE